MNVLTNPVITKHIHNSHIFCIRKKKTLENYFQWLFPIGGLMEIAIYSLVSSVS